MIKETEYNGWTNHETWLVNLHFGNALRKHSDSLVGEGYTNSVTADECREYVMEIGFDEAVDASVNYFAYDAISSFMSRVDWNEIAEHANEV
jgi:hypothetical protein